MSITAPNYERINLGSPVLVSNVAENRQFETLAAISSRTDGPNSYREDLLQALVENTPNILPLREFLPSSSALFSLGTEITVDIGDSDGRIDNLLVTNDGYLIIVETKLFRNPEATRSVVTQTMQYGMALSQMPILELEARIRRGIRPSLRRDETISECVSRLSGDDKELAGVVSDDFDEALEEHLRRGEILLLVVSDGIRVGVERITDWLNTQGSSSPLRFGLVELKFYAFGEQRIVVPRAVLKTREISRHVVLVDIKPGAEMNVAARVTDEFHNSSGGKLQESRPVKAASAPLTRNSLLQLVRPDDQPAASKLIDELETMGFDQQGTPATLKFGFTSDDEQFHSLVALDKSGAWVGPLKNDADLLGVNAMLAFRSGANRFAPFYKEEQLNRVDGFGHAGKYRQLEDSAAAFAAFLDEYRHKIGVLLQDELG